MNESILHTDTVDLLPTDIALAAIEKTVQSNTGGEYIFTDIPSPIKDEYDYILIDCMHSKGYFYL